MSAIALCYGRAATDTMLEGWLTSTCISCASSGLAPLHPGPSPTLTRNLTRILTLTLTIKLSLTPTPIFTLTRILILTLTPTPTLSRLPADP